MVIKIKPFSAILLKTNIYAKNYDIETKWLYDLIEENKLLKNFNDI